MSTSTPPYVIAIDGPAASGKSSVARRVARRLGFLYVNTGAMYRAVALLALERKVAADDTEGVRELLEGGALAFGSAQGEGTVLLDGVCVAERLGEPEVSATVSAIASQVYVREVLVARQREYRKEGNLVMEGRDIGSVVFAETPLKFFIDAAPEIRAQRRAAQGLVDNLSERDRKDSSRQASPMVVPEGAQVIDSSHLSLEQVVETVLEALKERGVA